MLVNYSATSSDKINTRASDLCEHKESMSFQIDISVPSRKHESTKKHSFKVSVTEAPEKRSSTASDCNQRKKEAQMKGLTPTSLSEAGRE